MQYESLNQLRNDNIMLRSILDDGICLHRSSHTVYYGYDSFSLLRNDFVIMTSSRYCYVIITSLLRNDDVIVYSLSRNFGRFGTNREV